MSNNVFKEARLRAAESNDSFRSAESAAGVLHEMSRERLLKIEQDDPTKKQMDPTRFDVLEMANAYGAPELLDYYCTEICPFGIGKKPLMYNNLGEISAKLMSSMHYLDNVSDDIYRILEDSVVSENEKKEFAHIIKTLRDISYSADSLELWAKKNGYID